MNKEESKINLLRDTHVYEDKTYNISKALEYIKENINTVTMNLEFDFETMPVENENGMVGHVPIRKISKIEFIVEEDLNENARI